jgi:hypothetical protein
MEIWRGMRYRDYLRDCYQSVVCGDVLQTAPTTPTCRWTESCGSRSLDVPEHSTSSRISRAGMSVG